MEGLKILFDVDIHMRKNENKQRCSGNTNIALCQGGSFHLSYDVLNPGSSRHQGGADPSPMINVTVI